MQSNIRKLGLGVLGGLLAEGIVIPLTSIALKDAAPDKATMPIRDLPQRAEPCGTTEAERVAVEDLNDRAGLDPYVPDHAKANEESLESSWYCAPDGMRLLFQSGVRIAIGRSELSAQEAIDVWTRFRG